MDNLTSSTSSTRSRGEGLSLGCGPVLCSQSQFIKIPGGVLADGSKGGLSAQLEFAEEKMKVNYVSICIRKGWEDRAPLLKTFSFLGFEVVRPGQPCVPSQPDVMLRVYPLDRNLSHEH
ncbi:ornithine decarboxylase antizyme 2-like [Myotis daubentonii]|uniref:ornithine decarboxylase antizyme 2-like n=1 Tax=Myotis daubentonii TaxID=98922 RepID=UPI00287330E9|nr:ornithine decarboxylase antizyme 2-like [Myotis daubentonii]